MPATLFQDFCVRCCVVTCVFYERRGTDPPMTGIALMELRSGVIAGICLLFSCVSWVGVGRPGMSVGWPLVFRVRYAGFFLECNIFAGCFD